MEANLETTKDPGPPQKTILIKFTFILFGIGSLLAWNAILTELSFLDCFVPKLDPFESTSFLNFAPNIIFQFILLWKKNLFKIEKQVIYGLISSIILLILLPISIIGFKEHEDTNMGLTIVLILTMGLINAFLCSGFFAFVSSFPLEMIIDFSTGQGFAGIFLNAIMYVIIPSVDSIDEREKKEKLMAIIFFSISVFVLLICLLFFIFSLKTEYFIYYLYKNKQHTNIGEINEEGETEGNYNDTNNGENTRLTDYNLKTNQEVSILQMFFLLWEIDLLCIFIYFVTFAMFPVAFEHQNIFHLNKYNMNTVLTLYNVFDTFGRFLVSAVTPTKIKAYLSILPRGILLVTIVLNYYFEYEDYNHTFTSLFLIFNISMLGLTNGIGTTLCFGIAPFLVNDELKGQAGSSVSLFTIIGIFIGSCFAFLTKHILKKIHEVKKK